MMRSFLFALCMILAFATPAATKTYTISVTQIVEHPALDAVRKGFEDKFAELGLKAEYNVHIAQGNIATANQIASQMMGEKPDLILAIATPHCPGSRPKDQGHPHPHHRHYRPRGRRFGEVHGAPGRQYLRHDRPQPRGPSARTHPRGRPWR